MERDTYFSYRHFDKHEMLNIAQSLRDVLKTSQGLLEDYPGIEGNENYIKYCLKKTKRANINDLVLKDFLDSTYNPKIGERQEIDIVLLLKMIKRQYQILDDIDSASDMFKPKWCKISKAIRLLHKIRFLYSSELKRIDNYLKENDDPRRTELIYKQDSKS